MSDQGDANCGNLVAVGRRDLVPVVAANPLVSRGIADLAKRDPLPKSDSNLGLKEDDLVSLILLAIELASLENKLLKDKIDHVLKTLTYREREIVKLRYGLGDGYTYTPEEVGRIFKVTPERINEIEAKVLRKLDGFIDKQAILGKPVAELNLSSRTRKCLDRLGVGSVDDLVSYSAEDLLESKHFGMMCLNEVREKLAHFGLRLQGD